MSHSFFLSLRADVSVSEGEGELVLASAEARISFRRLSLPLLAVLGQLTAGGEDEARLQQRVLDDAGAEALAKFVYYLHQLDKKGMLLRSVRSNELPLMTLVPTSRHFVWAQRPVDDQRHYVLSRFSHVRREGRELVLESPLAHSRIVLHGARGTALVHALSRPCLPAELSTDEPSLSVDALALLLGAGMIEVANEAETAFPDWEFQDLVFHASSRMGRHDRPVGGTYPFAGELRPPAALKPVDALTWRDLKRPDLTRIQSEACSLARAQEMQSTARGYGACPINLQQLGEFLYRTGRVLYCQQIEVQTPRGLVPIDFAPRPYPSGGALYPLEVYAVVNLCSELEPGLYYHDPLMHRLGLLGRPTAGTEELLAAAAELADLQPTSVQVLLVITARFQRRSWKYASIAYSNTLKDVGVLYQTMYLVAAAMGLAPRSLPNVDGDLFASAAGTEYYAETSVGAFLLGSHSDTQFTQSASPLGKSQLIS